jgi:hypothetical protein
MIRKPLLGCGLALLLVSLASGKQGHGKGKEHKAPQGSQVAVAVNIFAQPDTVVLRDYAMGFRGNLPPGLAKRGGDLPPGLEKQLVRKGHLPPGIEKKIVSFPPEIERRLSSLEPGYQRGLVAGHAVIFNSSTRLILDVFVPLD